MNEHLSIGELERFRAGEDAQPISTERTLADIQSHLESCQECKAQLKELTTLEALASRVRKVSSVDAAIESTELNITGYEIQHEIHRGGQGVVYAALQTSTARRVAIKVLLTGSMASEKQRARFEREIDLVARIDHPNVVSIIDRGLTDNGHGYLVMELVDGPTLDGYQRQRQISIQDRLELFLEICNGMQAAHQRGILHRDIKPANILIRQSGMPCVLDFGLAKDDLNNSSSIAKTVAGEFMGTLAYASPEQLSGDPDLIDLRTDVYSLGVLLYELLTGVLPHDMSGSIEAVMKRVLEQSPKPPSSINHKLDHDLDIVLACALEHESSRRYETVEAFARDIRAVLEFQPIQARRASTVYQVKKFARRNRAAVAIVSVMVVGVFGIIATLSLGIIRTNAANAIAEQRRVAAETELEKQATVSIFLSDLLAEVDPGQSGPDMRVTELLDIASQQITERFDQYPDIRGVLQSTVGETYTRLGSYSQAEEQLVAAIKALEQQTPASNLQLASTLSLLARVQSATARLDEADETLDRAESLIDLSDVQEQEIELRAQLFHQRGTQLYERGQFAESIAAYQDSIDGLGELGTQSKQRIASQSLVSLGVSYKRLERFDEALESYDRALELLKEVRSENHPDTLACLSNRAEVLNNLGKVEEAESQLVDLVARRKAVFGPSHERVGITLNNLADSIRARGDFAAAAPLFDKAIEIFRVNPGDPSLRLAMTIHNAGVMHLENAQLTRAHQQLEEAVKMSALVLPNSHWIGAQFAVKLAECKMMQGDEIAARDLLESARPDLASALGEDHRRVAHADQLLKGLTD